jgi:potassium channel subfamily K
MLKLTPRSLTETLGSGLTRKQRSLIIIVIILLCYVALGGLINSILLHLSFIDGLYFTLVTIETIGFGDIVPKSTGAKVWTCVYASVGIVYLAVAVRMCRDTVLEWLEVGYRKRVESMRRKRREMKRRRDVGARWRQQVEGRLRQKGEPVWFTEDSDSMGKWDWMKIWTLGESCRKWAMRRGGRSHLHLHQGLGGMHLNLDALTLPELEATAMAVGVPLDELLPLNYMMSRQRRKRRATRNSADGSRKSDVENEVGIEEGMACRGLNHPDMNKLTYARMGKMISMLGRLALSVHASAAPDGTMPKDDNLSIQPCDTIPPPTVTAVTGASGNGEVSTQNYGSFRKGMEKEERRAFMARLIVALSLFVLFWVVSLCFSSLRDTNGLTFNAHFPRLVLRYSV